MPREAEQHAVLSESACCFSGICRIIDGDFPKLAINPFFQIFVKGIIFGPNVRSPEKWEPYFQYQLNEMWKKDSSNSEKGNPANKKFFIKQSDIKYFT